MHSSSIPSTRYSPVDSQFPGWINTWPRAGVRYLVVENDVNPAESQTPPPVEVRSVLANEYGISRVAAFGPVVKSPNAGPGVERVYDPLGVTHGIRSLEVYRVAATGSGNAMVTTFPAVQWHPAVGRFSGLAPPCRERQLDRQDGCAGRRPAGTEVRDIDPGGHRCPATSRYRVLLLEPLQRRLVPACPRGNLPPRPVANLNSGSLCPGFNTRRSAS